jgi:hypothetical protein
MIRLSDNHTIGLAAVNTIGPRLQIDPSSATGIAPGPKGGLKMKVHVSNGIVRIGVRR